MRIFKLIAEYDSSREITTADILTAEDGTFSVKGAGVVAEIAVFRDGAAVLRWLKNASGIESTVFCNSLKDLESICLQGGKYRLESEISGFCQCCGDTFSELWQGPLVSGEPIVRCIGCHHAGETSRSNAHRARYYPQDMTSIGDIIVDYDDDMEEISRSFQAAGAEILGHGRFGSYVVTDLLSAEPDSDDPFSEIPW